MADALRRNNVKVTGDPGRPVVMFAHGFGCSQEAWSLVASFCSIDPEIARHFARVTFLSDNRTDLPLVCLPTLVLQCREDAIAGESVGRYVHAAIRTSRFALLDATGHVPNLSAPDEVADQILAFVA